MNNLAFQIYGSTKSGIFQSTWKTDNSGVSSSTQIELPLLSGGTYNFWIDWGDGSTTNVTSYSQRTHTYASAGTYTLRATGTVGIWQFANGGDKLKILTVSSWGKLILGPTAFYGCSNLTLSGITDIPNLSTVTSLSSTFAFCPLITTIGRLNEWDMSTITSMQAMFYTSGNFNQYIGDWNVSNVTNMDTMFWATTFNNGYASGVAGSLNWNTVKVTNMVNMFAYNTGFNQDISAWNVNKVTSFGNMFLRCITFNNGNNTNINPITLRPGIDGWDLNTTSNVALDGWMYTNVGSMIFNRNLNNWNTSKVISMSYMFSNCGSFNNGYASGVANQLSWNTSACTTMSFMFYQAPAFNSNIGTWDVSKVTSFAGMFQGASKFNNGDDSAPINSWNINTMSSVTMDSMFTQAPEFNRPIGSWNTSAVTNMYHMFFLATTFNQPIGDWNVSNVIYMHYMFYGAAAFNQSLSNWERSTVGNVSTLANVTLTSFMFQGATNFNNGLASGVVGTLSWNTSNITSMDSMFAYCSAFNQLIGSWNVSNVTNMRIMFNNATIFNQPIGSWDVSKVTTMYGLFAQARAFNQNIGSWNTSACTNMGYMFLCAFTAGGQFNNGGSTSISTWNTSACTDMNGMFWSQPSFNQPIGSWDVSQVTDMSYMFNSAYLFNQPLGAWNVSKVTNFINFMNEKTPATFSSTNLDAIYNGWIVNGVKPNINISFGTAKYTSAGTAGRLTLTSAPNNWIITDGGL